MDIDSKKNSLKASEYSSLVFNRNTQELYLDTEVIDCLDEAIIYGQKLDLKTADIIAAAMKDWAISKGATHYTHWFQPLNGTTSEKHNSFLVPNGSKGDAIFRFSGKELIKGESDASSFPTGGLRSTFEARGYTAWDPSSDAFIKDEVLCIPTAFCSYNGDAIDNKTPLLRSMDALDAQIKRFMKFFSKDVDKVDVYIGAEQEFFIISNEHFHSREDLVITGRTLFGNSPVKSQSIEGNYFGCIKPKINEYMKVLDKELWKLGVSAHAKHNEAAPLQMELAPIFCNANRAVDENLVTMEKMKLLAPDYDMAVLLHERPFEGVNGSGKHCNWSISVDDINLLDPGTTWPEHLRFVAIIACVIAAVDEYQELLRMSVASCSNDRRLGANEAPPAIVSIFLGNALEAMIDAVSSHKNFDLVKKDVIDLGVNVIPWIMRDAADRNRTSPFAFSDNKFEFRMPGSSVNLSDSVMVLNTAVSKALYDFCDSVSLKYDEKKNNNDSGEYTSDLLDSIILEVCVSTIDKHKKILFDGDGYSDAWKKEAKTRGLANSKTTAEALNILRENSTQELFEKFNVLSENEIMSRYKIKLDKYIKEIQIESRVMQRMVKRLYLPAICSFYNDIARQVSTIIRAITGFGQVCGSIGKRVADAEIFASNTKRHAIDFHKELLLDLVNGIHNITEKLHNLEKLCSKGEKIVDTRYQSYFYAKDINNAMEELRLAVDDMEHITPSKVWPVPSYNEILFNL